MNIRQYLFESDLTQRDLADGVGASQQHISRIATDQQDASLALAVQIQHFTCGIVNIADLPISPETRATLDLIRDLVREGETFE